MSMIRAVLLAALLVGPSAILGAAEVRQFGNPPDNTDISYAFTVGPDSVVYLATISDGLAKFLRFDPARPEMGIAILGEPSTTETFVNSGAIMVGADGKIYAGTYPGATLISYDPATGALADHGRMDETQKYNKQLAQGTNGWIYNGVGVDRAQIIAWHPPTGDKRPIVPGDEGSAGAGYVYSGVDGHAYGSVGDQHFRLIDGRGVAISPAEKASEITTPLADGRELIGAGITDFVAQTCAYRLYDPATDRPQSGEFAFEGAGVGVYALGEGPGGVIYGSTILPMEIFAYDPRVEELSYLGHLGSGELYSLANWNGVPFFSSYPGSGLWRYDSLRPWDPGWGMVRNPSMVVGKYGLGTGHLRPHCTIVGPNDHLYIGSVAGYGTIGGGLAVFDPVEGRVLKNYRDHFQTAGVVSLAYDPVSGLVFGGGDGVFILDPAQERIVENLSVPTPNSMCVVEGRLFFASSDGLHVLDIDSRRLAHHAPIDMGAQQRNSLSQHADGLIYGLTDRAIYTVDPDTFTVTPLASLPVTARCGWAVNESGIYFGSADHVWRYRLDAREFDDLGVAATTANLYGHMVGPDANGDLTMLYFLFKTGHGLFMVQVKPDPLPSDAAPNLMANADFEANGELGEVPSSWTAQASYGQCELTDAVNHTLGGSRSVKVTVMNANGGNCLQPLPSPDDFPYGADLFVSGWVYVREGEKIDKVRMYAHLKGGHAFINAETPVGESFPRNRWTRVGPIVVRVKPEGFYPGATLLLAAFGEAGASAYFDDVAIDAVTPTPAR